MSQYPRVGDDNPYGRLPRLPHKGDDGFPPAVKEKSIRKWIATLEAQRAAAEKSQTKARQDMDEYNTSHKSIDKDAARSRQCSTASTARQAFPSASSG